MVLFVDMPQPLAADMGVNLRRANVRMTKQLLYHTQIGPVLEQVRRETVSEHVWSNVLLDACAFRSFLDSQPHCHCGKGRAAFRQKNIRR